MAEKSEKNSIVRLVEKLRANKFIQAVLFFLTSPKLKTKVRKWGWAIIRSIFLLGFCFVILYPILLIISKTFMLRDDLYDPSVILIPKNFTFYNILWIASFMDYWNALKNTVIIAGGVTLFQIAACLMIGYGFARFNFKLKGILFGLVIFTLIVPPQIMMSALYMNYRFFNPLGLVTLFTGSKKGWNLITGAAPYFMIAATGMGIKNGLLIYIFRQFFRNMPKETEEAALVDGAGTFKTFYKIMVPDALTAIVTVALFSFVWQYNDSVFSTLFTPPSAQIGTKSTNMLLMTNAYDLVGSLFLAGGEPRYVAATMSTAVFLILLPPVTLYLILQRFFIQSIERTGVVG